MPPKGPLLGTGSAPADLALHGTKAMGSGDRQKGGGGGQQGQNKRQDDDEQGEGLSSDQASFRGGSPINLSETLTIHAAVSHLQGLSEATTLSAVQLTEFKSLLNRHRPRPLDNERPPAGGNAYVVGGLGEATWFSVNRDHDLNEAELLAEFEQETAVPEQLEEAVRRPFVNLPDDLAPRSAHDEARLFLLTTDPRQGFAPEGIAAWVAECRNGLRLERSRETNFDFVESDTGRGWHIAPARSHAARPIAELQHAVQNAATAGADLLIDATKYLKVDGTLGVAMRELSKTQGKNRVMLVTGPAKQVLATQAA